MRAQDVQLQRQYEERARRCMERHDEAAKDGNAVAAEMWMRASKEATAASLLLQPRPPDLEEALASQLPRNLLPRSATFDREWGPLTDGSTFTVDIGAPEGVVYYRGSSPSAIIDAVRGGHPLPVSRLSEGAWERRYVYVPALRFGGIGQLLTDEVPDEPPFEGIG